MFKTELHTHSSSVSNCSHVSEDEIIRRYIVAGYTTVLLTNHLSRFTYRNKNKDLSGLSWDEKIDYYMNGYRRMQAAALGRINVLLGIELRSNTDENDYLIYGVGEDFMRAHPEIMDTKISEVVDEVHKWGGLFYQAHPFRNGIMVKKPELLDGIEVYNGHRGHDSRNDIAYMWAEKFGLRKISGTDYHESDHVIGAGIRTSEPITTNAELIEVLKSENYELIREGAVTF